MIVNLVFPYLGFWSGNFLLIVQFPDHCLFLPADKSNWGLFINAQQCLFFNHCSKKDLIKIQDNFSCSGTVTMQSS